MELLAIGFVKMSNGRAIKYNSWNFGFSSSHFWGKLGKCICYLFTHKITYLAPKIRIYRQYFFLRTLTRELARHFFVRWGFTHGAILYCILNGISWFVVRNSLSPFFVPTVEYRMQYRTTVTAVVSISTNQYQPKTS